MAETPILKEPIRRTPLNPPSNGVARARSVRTAGGTSSSARAAARGSPFTIGRKETSEEDEAARAETAKLIEDLNAQLKRAESTCEDYEKQMAVLKSKYEDALTEQARLEEIQYAHAARIEALLSEQRETVRQKKEVETLYEAEKGAFLAEREEASSRETELHGIIQRLRSSSATNKRLSIGGDGSLSRSSSFRGRSSPKPEDGTFEAPGLVRRDSSQNSKLILQKDKVIEELRLEIAEAQIKLMEVENAGGGRFQDLERQLLETRMSNAKLMEENESYQFLLQERTLNGQIANQGMFHLAPPSEESRTPSRTTSATLADELSGANEDSEISTLTDQRKLESEITALKDQNKALTLYINRIISRLLDNDKFEALFETGAVTGENPLNAAAAQTNKELPRPPSSEQENAGASLLQRAGSIFGGGKRPRPKSTISGSEGSTSAAKPPPNPMENPVTAPSVPLRHRRLRSSEANTLTPSVSASEVSARDASPSAASDIVNKMYRGGSGSSASGRPLSPPALGVPRSNPFSPPVIQEDDVAPDAPAEAGSRRRSSIDERQSDSGYGDSLRGTPGQTSPPSSIAPSSIDARSTGAGGGGGTVINSGGMRPLRLVQAEEAAMAEKKKANRASWMPGWMGRGVQAVQGAVQLPGGVVGGEKPASSDSGGSRPGSKDG